VNGHSFAHFVRLPSQIAPENAQHGLRIVHALDFDSLSSNGQQNAASAARNLQHRPAGFPGEIDVERHVDQILL
jgi:hypothetical protein